MAVRWLKYIRIQKFNGSISTRATANFKDSNVAKLRTYLHDDKYVVVPANKVFNNNVVVCKSNYIDCLIKEIGIGNSIDNPTYTPVPMILTKVEIQDNHPWNFKQR